MSSDSKMALFLDAKAARGIQYSTTLQQIDAGFWPVIMQYFLIIRLTSTKKFKKLIGHKHKFKMFLLVKSSVPENN